jgi:hypothetical protein
LRNRIGRRFREFLGLGNGGLVGCGHMSGPFVRRIMAAGPDGVRGSAPYQECALKKRVELSGSSRSTARPFRHHFLFTLAGFGATIVLDAGEKRGVPWPLPYNFRTRRVL